MSSPASAHLDLPIGSTSASASPIPAPRLGASQNVSYNAAGGSATSSSAFGPTTYMIEINVSQSSTASGVRIAIGTSGSTTAGSTSKLCLPGSTLYYRVYPGEILSALSDDTNTGSVNIVECAAAAVPIAP